MKKLWADPDGVFRKSLEDGAMREALEKLLEEGWAPGGEFRRMVEDPNSAFWTGMARGIARRRAATEARWAEQRKAHAATGLGGSFFDYGTEFEGVRYVKGSFQMRISVGGGKEVCMTYRDENVAALAVDLALRACGCAPCNYPTRAVCLAVPPSTAVIEEMMRQAAGGGPAVGGGPTTRVVIRETIDQYRVRWVVAMTLAREKARIRETVVLDELAELRTRTGVLTDDVSDAIAARVDALDLERMLGDRLRAEGFAEPPGDGRAAAGKKRCRASSDDPEARAMSNDLVAIRAAYAKEQGLPADKRSRA